MSTTAIQSYTDRKPEARSLVASMSMKYGLEPDKFLSAIQKTVFPKDVPVTIEQTMAFLVVANEYDLNPFTREIYAFPGKGGGIVAIISVDGRVSLVQRHKQFDGMEFIEIKEGGKLVAMTCRIHRKDLSRPIEVTEYLEECKRNTEPWSQMPHRMIRHKCFSQCSRYAFGFSGLYDEDEAKEIADTPGGALDLEPDSPIRAAIPPLSKTPAAEAQAALHAPISGEHEVTPQLFVNFFVGRDRTRITGQTQPIEKELRKIFAERSKDGKAWEISSSSTERFLKLCEDAHISAIEVNENGEPMAPATLLDLYQGQDS